MNAFSELGRIDADHSRQFPRFIVGQYVRDASNNRKGVITKTAPEGYFVDFWGNPDAAILMTPDMITWTLQPGTDDGLTGRALEIYSAFRLLHEIKPILTSRYIVKGWLDRGALSVVYGDSSVGKTFFALDLAMHVAAAQDWHGHKVPDNQYYAGPVVYVDCDGGALIDNRVCALRIGRPHLMKYTEESGDFVKVSLSVDLCTSGDADHIVTALGELDLMHPALVVIDTLARAIGNGDENTAKDMGAFVRNIDHIRQSTGAHVMVIHHTGKDASRGARGSGSLRGAADTEIELTSSGPVIIAENKKQRDGKKGSIFAYTLQEVFLGNDEDGDPVTSAIVEPSEAPAKRAPRLRGQALIAMQAFGDALAAHGVTKSGGDFPTNRQCVSLDHWREACDRHSLTDGSSASAARQAFGRAWKQLQEKEIIRVIDGFAWRCGDE